MHMSLFAGQSQGMNFLQPSIRVLKKEKIVMENIVFFPDEG
jgi:hypothetical protein